LNFRCLTKFNKETLFFIHSTPQKGKTMSHQVAVVEVLARGFLSPHHCPLRGDSPMILDETDGSSTIWESDHIFTGGIDHAFRGLNVTSSRTDATRLVVCCEAKGMTCQCFPNFKATACGATQHQVVLFAEKYATHIRNFGISIWFPFQLHTLLYIASIDVDSCGRLKVRRIELQFGVDACSVIDGHHGVVILQAI
jgi:hypothetical protein